MEFKNRKNWKPTNLNNKMLTLDDEWNQQSNAWYVAYIEDICLFNVWYVAYIEDICFSKNSKNPDYVCIIHKAGLSVFCNLNISIWNIFLVCSIVKWRNQIVWFTPWTRATSTKNQYFYFLEWENWLPLIFTLSACTLLF